jgi:hypothetical protein
VNRFAEHGGRPGPTGRAEFRERDQQVTCKRGIDDKSG